MKIIDDLLINRMILSKIPDELLQSFLNTNEKKRMKLVSLAQNYPNKEELIMHFKEYIIIPWWLAVEYLQCSKYELSKYKNKLGYVGSYYAHTEYRPGYRDYYLLDTVLKSKDRMNELRQQYAEELKIKRDIAGKKAAQTKKDRIDNMPLWIKNNDCIFESQLTYKNIKKYFLIEILNKNYNNLRVNFKFGNMEGIVIIYYNEIMFKIPSVDGISHDDLKRKISFNRKFNVEKKLITYLKQC